MLPVEEGVGRMMLRRSHMRVVLVVALGLTAVVGITAGSAATTSKPYTAVFDAGPVPGGSSLTINLVLENRASPQSIGSANVTAPNGFTITGAIIQGAGNVDSSSTLTLLKLRSLAIAPQTSRTVAMTVTTPCAVDTYTWEIRTKQSNDFSGPPGNDFFLVSGDSNLDTTVGGGGTPDHLEFIQQPPNHVQKSTVISPAVQVKVVDTCANSASQATDDVSLTLVQPGNAAFGGGGTLGGDTDVAPDTNGVATFNDLTVDVSGLGYALEASYPGLGDTTQSNPFNVYDSLGDCSSGCSASNSAGTNIGVQGFSGTIGLGVGPANNTSECGTGLTPLGSTFVVAPLNNGTFTAVLTIEKRGLQGVGVANIVVCVSSDPSQPLQTLSKCAKKNPTPKCIVSQTSSHAGDALITMLFNGDPVGGGFG